MKKVEKIKLKEIKCCGFSREKDMQKMIGDNLQEIFGLDFLDFEFRFGSSRGSGQNRIDILAFDRKLESFVIIECKNKKTSDIIGQGQSYVNLMKQHELRFYGEYQKKTANPVSALVFEEKKPKLILISTEYTKRQKDAVGDNSQIELWEVKAYENNTVSFKRVDKAAPKDSSQYIMFNMKKNPQDNDPPGGTKNKPRKTSAKSRSESDYFKRKTEHAVDLYKKFKSEVLKLDKDITPKFNSNHIAFDINSNSNIVSVQIQTKKLKIWIGMPRGKLNGRKEYVEDVFDKGRDGAGGYQIFAESVERLEYILRLVKQTLKYKKSNER